MRTLFTVIIMVIMASTAVAETTVNSVISNDDFLTICQKEFRAEYGEKPEKAEILTQGMISVQTGINPEQYQKTAYFALIEGDGTITVMFNVLMCQEAVGKIWDKTGADPSPFGKELKPTDWTAVRTYVLGSQKVWLHHSTDIAFTQVSLGIGDSKEFTERFSTLKTMGILANPK